jgi:hypothetical protein
VRPCARLALFFATAVLAMPACVPVASLPVEAQVGVGARTHRSSGDPLARADVPFQLRASVRPLEFAPSLLYRRADFGAGYLLDVGARSATQGAYVEAASIPYVGRPTLLPEAEATRRTRKLLPEGDTVRRLMLRAQGRLLHNDRAGDVGGGFALQVTYEWLIFTSSPGGMTNTKSGFGSLASYAEAGIGFFAEGAYSSFPSGDIWSASLGLVFKLPAAIGIFCCVIPRL